MRVLLSCLNPTQSFSSLFHSTVAVSLSTYHLIARHKDAISAVESFAKIIALGVAAFWTWKTFIRTRLRFPSATVEHLITSWIDEGKVFLRVTVRVTNTGSVVIRLAEGKTWIEKLTPVPSTVRDALNKGSDPVEQGKHEITWSLIKKYDLGSDDKIEIEPNESDELHFDFAIEPQVSRVLVYTHLRNRKKRFIRRIGWNLSSIYAIGSVQKDAK